MTTPHRILCIEDDVRVLRLLAEDLSDAGYLPVTAVNAAAGIESFFDQAPELVLCDIRMPGHSGFEFVKRLRLLDARLFDTVFIFLTALADRDHELSGRRLGADDYISKPIDYEILREVINVRLTGRTLRGPAMPMPATLRASLAAWFAGPPLAPPFSLVQALQQHHAVMHGRGNAMGIYSVTDLLSPALNAISLGVIILNRAGVIKYVNHAASAVLVEAQCGAPASRDLIRFIRTHVGPDAAHGQDGTMAAARLPIGHHGANVVIIARKSRHDAASAEEHVTVLVPTLPDETIGFGDLLTSLFGLTQAERSLAADICAGERLSDVAAARGVALPTVRSQLRAVFAKVGVTRQADLVRALMMLQVAVS